MAGRNDFATETSVSQKAALSGKSEALSIAPNTLSKAKISIPAEKHQVASERWLRQTATTARPALNKAATKARMVLKFTIGSKLREWMASMAL